MVRKFDTAVSGVGTRGDDAGRLAVPNNLAALSKQIVDLHRRNGNLGWLADMIAQANHDGEALQREVEAHTGPPSDELPEASSPQTEGDMVTDSEA